MATECNQAAFEFQPSGGRDVVGRFGGGTISSDSSGVLLREVEPRTGILRRFAACFTDHRDGELIEHSVEDLVAQREYAVALGYEDLLDHDDPRHDPLLAAMVGKKATAICRCTSSAASTCWRPRCGRPTPTARRERRKSSDESSSEFGRRGRRSRSCCAGTPAFAVKA